MLKVVCIVDKDGTALDRLGKGVAPFHRNLNYSVIACHPKRPSQEELDLVESSCKDADIIDAQYYKTIEKLREVFPWLRDKKTILTHNNPYSIEEKNWNDYDAVVANNKTMYKRLGEITEAPLEYIPLTTNTDLWRYNFTWSADATSVKNVIMVANRIEGKKGILPVAEACKKLGLNLQLVGSISDPDYFQKIVETGVVRFHEKIHDGELRDLYYKSTVHICNSVDGFESGTMPILEAMLCGTPVITRNVGHVPDLYNGENMVINENDPENVDALVDIIHNLISDKKKMEDMRDKAWQTAKTKGNQRRAVMYQKLYRHVLFPDQIPVSVVIPICNNPEVIRKSIDAACNQTYKNVEIVVADDNVAQPNEKLVAEIAQFTNIPVRYINTGAYIIDRENPKGIKDYGLARARNVATIYATGDLIVYADQRQILDKECVEQFVLHAKPSYWLFGNKGAKKGFIENLSCIYRDDILRIGGFNERINMYGGQSEELRKRMVKDGISNEYVESAKATPSGKSSNRTGKRTEIVRMKDKIWMMFDAQR